MKQLRPALLLLAALFLSLPVRAIAEEPKPDDRVIFDLSAEDWVSTKTARVTISVEAAVTSNTAGTMRATMTKAVNDVVKAEWRLVSFNRDQDNAGMERWSAEFEARVPETDLSGLHENAKKLSKAGMQLSISNIDFSPTLDEMQTAYNQLRTKIYKMANEQLSVLNTALPGRTYRIALINFTSFNDISTSPPTMPTVTRGFAEAGIALKASSPMPAVPAPSMERSEKINLTARVVLAVTAPGHAPPPSGPAPAARQ